MNITAALIMGAAGTLTGWFIPLIATKTAEYKQKKKGEILPDDPRFTSPLVKAACLVFNGACWAAAGMFTGNLLHAILIAVILFDAAVITVVDLRIRLIPNEAVLLMLLAGFIHQIAFFSLPSVITSLTTMLAVMFVFTILGTFLGLNSVGAGDVKLAGAMGLTLGWPYIMYGLIGMSALMLFWCCGGLIIRKLNLKSMLAFAPFMMAGTVFAIVASITGF